MESLNQVRHELSVNPHWCLLRGHRLVIPSSLTDQVVQLAHNGHQGMVKTKSNLQTKVGFPLMDEKVEELVHSCEWCQASGEPSNPAPAETEFGPHKPWVSASLDSGSLHNGRHTMMMIDYHLKYSEVEIISTLTADRVIPKIEKILAIHGLISEIKTDNGPPFQSNELVCYFESIGIKHRKLTLWWPQANGEVEHMMQTLNKVIRITSTCARPLVYAIYSFQRRNRQTPDSTTGRAPGYVSLGRAVADSIRHHCQWQLENIDDFQVHQRRTCVIRRANRRCCAKASNLNVGDTVPLKDQFPDSKFQLLLTRVLGLLCVVVSL
ncbi:hypothetical protein NDU88_005034 [Pleurodeles waltl]|uniref:Gypsy retrotransposon integrase-like protein 1 n=1 Tax=Pleurodeles waltl TaxID=8319 RepID=A0AAV7NP22_PLEWA|nr:hypothetical protein NDU88_005034 [Pleurodeles waltl]